MRLLNLGCGSNRPGEPWTNLDDLISVLKPGTPEFENLIREKNYINYKLPGPLPFSNNHFDGILASHVIEHFDCHEAVDVMNECYLALKPGGILVVSVPDAEYFLKVYDQDTKENAEKLFGEPIHDDWQPNFFSYALFHQLHKQVLSHDTLRCLFLKAGFTLMGDVISVDTYKEIEKIMNRRKFSLEMCAIKSA